MCLQIQNQLTLCNYAHKYYLVGRFRDTITSIKDSLLAQGYPSFTMEDFHDTVRLQLYFVDRY